MRLLAKGEAVALRAFAAALPATNWLFFAVGLCGAAGTVAGLLPPFSNSWWAKVTSTLLWLLLAREGYEPIAEGRAGGDEAAA